MPENINEDVAFDDDFVEFEVEIDDKQPADAPAPEGEAGTPEFEVVEAEVIDDFEDLTEDSKAKAEERRQEKGQANERAQAEKENETAFNKDAVPMLSEVIVNVLDIGVSKLIAHFAGVQDSDELCFSEKEGERLSKPLSAYLRAAAPSAIKLSPGWLFLAMFAFLIACKFLKAYGAELNDALSLDNIFPEVEKENGKGRRGPRGPYKKRA